MVLSLCKVGKKDYTNQPLPSPGENWFRYWFRGLAGEESAHLCWLLGSIYRWSCSVYFSPKQDACSTETSIQDMDISLSRITCLSTQSLPPMMFQEHPLPARLLGAIHATQAPLVHCYANSQRHAKVYLWQIGCEHLVGVGPPEQKQRNDWHWHVR